MGDRLEIRCITALYSLLQPNNGITSPDRWSKWRATLSKIIMPFFSSLDKANMYCTVYWNKDNLSLIWSGPRSSHVLPCLPVSLSRDVSTRIYKWKNWLHEREGESPAPRCVHELPLPAYWQVGQKWLYVPWNEHFKSFKPVLHVSVWSFCNFRINWASWH